MCDDDHSEYISAFHADYMREYIRFELERQERVSTHFLQTRLRGRPATPQEQRETVDRMASDDHTDS